MTSAYRPKHEHDCNRCVLLGAHIFEGVWHDLYFCPACDGGTVIARHGLDERYHSLPVEFLRPPYPGKSSCEPINTAARMATERGLIHAPDTA